MRLCLLILGSAVLSASACPSIDAQSSVKNETPAVAGRANLCTEGGIICVSKAVTNSLVNNV